MLLLIAANGVFVAAEFSLVAADRGKIDSLADQGSRPARVVRSLLSRLAFQLSGSQLGITVTSLMIGFLAEPAIAHLFEPLLSRVLPEGVRHAAGVVIALLLATMAQMVLGEMIPKTLAIAKPETVAMVLARFMQIYSTVFGPAIRLLNGAASWTVRRLGVEPRQELESVRSLPELARLVRASATEGTIGDRASDLFNRSVRFGQKTAADALIPRVAVSALARDDRVTDLVALAASTGFSRFPVYGADLDDIVGIVLVKSAHSIPPADRHSVTVGALMTDVVAVPETRSLHGLLSDMRDARNHLAVVVDEYGGTAGIITLEDVIEEIVGEIDDEYDPRVARLTEAPTGTGPWDLSGSLHPDEVLDATGFSPPEGEYETLAGFVLDRLGHIPEPGETVAHDGWRLEVTAMDGLRVAGVRLSHADAGDAP